MTGDKPHFCLGIAAPPLLDGSAVWVAEKGLSDGLASPSVRTEGVGQKGVQSDCGLPHSHLLWRPLSQLQSSEVIPYVPVGRHVVLFGCRCVLDHVPTVGLSVITVLRPAWRLCVRERAEINLTNFPPHFVP